VTALGVGVVAFLGFALNDSGITIPGMMAAVTEAALVILLVRVVLVRTVPSESRHETSRDR
jgi:hypothetical protein